MKKYQILTIATCFTLCSSAYAGITKKYSEESESKKQTSHFERRTVSERESADEEESATHFGKRSLTSRDRVASRKSRIAKEAAARKQARKSSGGGGGGC